MLVAEGCIVQRYIDKECLTFCSMYLNDVDTIFNKVERNNEMVDFGGEISIFSCKGRPFELKELEKFHTKIREIDRKTSDSGNCGKIKRRVWHEDIIDYYGYYRRKDSKMIEESAAISIYKSRNGSKDQPIFCHLKPKQGMENPSHKKLKQVSGKRQYQGVENPSHKKQKHMSGKTKRFDSSQMEMGGPGKGAFARYDHQKKPSSKPSSSKPVSSMPSRYLRMQDEELHVEETRNSISPSQSRGRRVTTRNQEEQYLQEHYHEYETRNSFSPPQSHGRRVRIDTNEAYQQEQQHEGDSIQTETCMSDDEDEEENIGSTSHVTRKETRALGETRKSRLNKGSLVFEVDESFGRIIGKNSQGFITKGGCVMRKYAKLDGTTWKKQPDLLKTDIISKTTMLPEFCLEQFTADLKICTTNLLGLLKMTWNLWSENSDFDFKCTRMRSAMSSQLGYQHRNHQYKLHIHYKEYETMEEAMTHPPKGIEVSDWVLLCERFASEDFQKISEKNKKNRSKNLVPPTVGTRSLARRVDESRREGKEVSEIEQYKMAHYSKKLKGMINEEADTIWNDLQTEEATSSCTSAEICLKKLGHLPGHIKGRSASNKQILETVNLRSELKALKEENKATNEKVDYLLEEMKKMAQLLQHWNRTAIVSLITGHKNMLARKSVNYVGHPNLFMVRRLGMLKAYDRKTEASHKFRLEVLGNRPLCLGHNLFSVGQFCDSDLEVAFRRNTCFFRNLEGVDLLKGNRTTNLYTINLHEMASASLISLIARATSTKSWLWHQRLSHLNFDTINDLAKNDLVTCLSKFKYHKEHLCPLCEQEKSKKASHPPKPVPNSKQRLHLLYMDLCGPMRVESINEKRYILVIVDDYSRYMWVHFLRSKDEAPEAIKTFLKKIQVLLQAPVTINDREDIGKLGVKGDIGFFIGYFANSCAYRVYNRRTKKIMETMNITFDELSAMDFKQRSSKPRLQGMTSGKSVQDSILPMYDDYIGGQPSAATTTTPAAQAPQVLQTPTASTTTADTAPTPTNTSSQATDIPNTS
ncbi:integrase, catalytic region, zinc finger, CCHC-type containing protein [Tanacetum coccineum]